MKYEFMADLFLLYNFTINTGIYILTCYTMNQKVKLKKIILTALLESLLLTVLFCILRSFAAYFLIVTIVIHPFAVWVLASRQNRIRFYCRFLLFFICSGGALEAVCIQKNGIPFAGKLAVLILLWTGVAMIIRYQRSKQKWVCNVELQEKEQSATCLGYFDSGNQLTDPYVNRPVHIVSQTIANRLLPEQEKLTRMVPYCSLGNTQGLLKACTIDNMVVNGKAVGKSVIAIGDEELFRGKSYQMILNQNIKNKILEEIF